MGDEEPLSERVQQPVEQHPDDGHTHEPAKPAASVAPPAAPPPVTPAPVAPAPVPPPAPEEKRVAEPPKVKFKNFNGKVTKMETHHEKLWEFDYDLDQEIDFKAGQYVSIVIPGEKPAPFSIASSPTHKKTLQLGIEIVGKVTGMLEKMKPGDTVPMKGPFGNFVMEDHERKVCFFAGGIGITPFISMARWIRDTHPDRYAVLFYSCKTKDQFMWLEELEEIHRTCENIKVVFTVTRETPDNWQHELGRVDEKMIREQIPDFDEYVYFSCGPVSLIDGMFDLLAGMGVKKENLRREAWH